MKILSASLLALIAAPAMAMPTPAYVRAAGAGDLYERQSSQIVLQSTRDPRVRGFAQMMLRDHMNSTAKIKTAARQSGVPVKPPMLMPRQAQMISELRMARGADRDAAYVRQQKMAHEEALATHRDYASTGTARPLRRTAAAIVPVVEHHIEMLRGM